MDKRIIGGFEGKEQGGTMKNKAGNKGQNQYGIGAFHLGGTVGKYNRLKVDIL